MCNEDFYEAWHSSSLLIDINKYILCVCSTEERNAGLELYEGE